MIDSSTAILIICIYVGILFLIATLTEKRQAKGGKWSNSAVVYSLSLAIYCTTWTYYGSVGSAATSGFLFLTIYLGPTLSIILWWTVLRKLVRIKQNFRINSIADFLAARYENSQLLAALATIIAIIGISPYIALQFKAVFSTFGLITHTGGQQIQSGFGLLVVLLMIAFTIIFGVRRLDPTERHQGMVMAVAVESVVKLMTFLLAGVFVTYFLFDGFQDIFTQLEQSRFLKQMSPEKGEPFFTTWVTYLILSMSAILFLPRQFHVAVVENSNENHIKTAMWLFPLYMFLINIFVFPIAAGGLLKELAAGHADTFVLRLPLMHGRIWIALLVFVGGFSAAASMIMISSMTMATMVSNHLFLPLAERIPQARFLRRKMLQARWFSVAVIIGLGYWFEKKLGGTYTLVNMGIISFAAALQFAPPIIGGLFWPRGNRTGAILGLSSGFLVWFYTLLLPSFIKSGWMSPGFLEHGPWGLSWLRPEALFGISGVVPLTHAVFWSMFFNVGLYTLGSMLTGKRENQHGFAVGFQTMDGPPAPALIKKHGKPHIDLSAKKERLKKLFTQYFPRQEAEDMIDAGMAALSMRRENLVTVLDLADLCSEMEKRLAGSVGTAAAHKAFALARIFNQEESQELSDIYGQVLAELKLTPEQLKQKVDFYMEREGLLSAHANELEGKVTQLQQEVRQREQAEKELGRLQSMLSNIVDSMPSVLVGVDSAGRVLQWNHKAELATGVSADDARGQALAKVFPRLELEMERVKKAIASRRPQTDPRLPIGNGQSTRFESVTVYPLVTNGVEGAVIRLDDVTERVRIEEMMIQTEKMMSVGGLAAGMAHEINNPLAGILQSVQIVKNRVSQDLPANVAAALETGVSLGDVRQYLEKRDILKMLEIIRSSGERAAEIVENMLQFSRRSSSDFSAHGLKNLLELTVDLAASDYDLKKEYDFRNIRIIREYAPDPPVVQCDNTMIQQVLLNLLKNAAQAMTANRKDMGRDLEITLRLYKESGEAVIEVQDNGPGFSEETRKRIFEPFFTTKDVGVGTGLGLSVSYFIIVDTHGGAMEAESEPGQGARFIIRLPIYGETGSS